MDVHLLMDVYTVEALLMLSTPLIEMLTTYGPGYYQNLLN